MNLGFCPVFDVQIWFRYRNLKHSVLFIYLIFFVLVLDCVWTWICSFTVRLGFLRCFWLFTVFVMGWVLNSTYFRLWIFIFQCQNRFLVIGGFAFIGPMVCRLNFAVIVQTLFNFFLPIWKDVIALISTQIKYQKIGNLWLKEQMVWQIPSDAQHGVACLMQLWTPTWLSNSVVCCQRVGPTRKLDETWKIWNAGYVHFITHALQSLQSK